MARGGGATAGTGAAGDDVRVWVAEDGGQKQLCSECRRWPRSRSEARGRQPWAEGGREDACGVLALELTRSVEVGEEGGGGEQELTCGGAKLAGPPLVR